MTVDAPDFLVCIRLYGADMEFFHQTGKRTTS